jgi:hypothetical protein
MPVLATALTLAAVGSQLAGSAQSFAQARKQKAKQREAEATADKYMREARRKLEKNYMESLAIQKEPYELEREAALAAGAQATEALRESDRGMGRVGAIYGQQQQAQRQIAAAMGQELFNLDYLTAQEESRLRDIGTQLDLGEVTGAQLEAANAEERRQQQLQAGIQGIGGAAMTGLDALALYGKQKTPTVSSADSPSMSELVSQADLGLGQSAKGIQANPSQEALYNVNQMPPQIPLTPQEQIMSIQSVDQSLLSPIGDAPTEYMLPPTKRFISSLNPFSLFRRQTTN